MKDHVIICGLGNIGFHVFELLNRAGVSVAVISDKTHAEWVWKIEQSGGLFLQGDARDDNLLLDAGVNEAKAILALTSQDRINLSIAVDAQKLNPKIKIISRIYDTDLGNLVAATFDIEQVFSTTELAAPLFYNSVSGETILGQFAFNGECFSVVEEQAKTLENASYKVLANIDQTYLLAKPFNRSKKKKSTFLKFLRHYYSMRTPVFMFFRRFLLILLGIILASTFFLAWAMPLSFVNALYFVIATVSSVGYGDINFYHSTTSLKYFGCLLMLTGTAIIAILFSAVTEMVISRKLPNLVGGRPMPRKNHIIVVGGDHIGTRIVNALIEEGMPVVVIENDLHGRFQEDIASQIAIVSGNPKSANTLLRANILSAKALLAVTKDDIENLSISIAAKKLNPNVTEITQINNTKIGGSLQEALSLTKVVSTPYVASPYFVAAVFHPNVIFAIEWKNKIIYLSNDKGEIKIDSILLTSE
jgi:Trk K+ transport system NAD-binding subunit